MEDMEKVGNSVIIRKRVTDDALASLPIQGKKLLEPFKSLSAQHKLPINILEDKDVSDNVAEIHKNFSDLWLCLEGEVVFTLGGELVDPYVKDNPSELKAKTIKGGAQVVLKSGDWLYIPSGEAHVHNCEKGVTRLVIIKIPSAS